MIVTSFLVLVSSLKTISYCTILLLQNTKLNCLLFWHINYFLSLHYFQPMFEFGQIFEYCLLLVWCTVLCQATFS